MQLDMGSSWLNISQTKFREWDEKYGKSVDVASEIKKMSRWWQKQPPSKKRWKSLVGAERWLQRAYENNPRNQREITTKPEDSLHVALRAPETAREPIYAPPPFTWDELKASLTEPESAPEKQPLISECKHEYHQCRYLRVNRCIKCETILEGFVWPTTDGKPHTLAFSHFWL